MSRRVHFVSDGGPGEADVADVVRAMAAALPDAVIEVTAIAPGDSVAAGRCVAKLARSEGANQLVVHDVTPRHGEPLGGEPFCIGRSRTGVLVVGANVGFTWSFVIDELIRLCCMDLPATIRDRCW